MFRYLPPYSPNFNPTKMDVFELKAILRGTAQRNLDSPWDAIKQAMERLTLLECANYSAAAYQERRRLEHTVVW